MESAKRGYTLHYKQVMRHQIPTARLHTIDRPRLLTQVAEWRSLRFIEIVAPAGFGKTTFTISWLRRLADEGVDCAWLTLDAARDDNDDDVQDGMLSLLLRSFASSWADAAELLGKLHSQALSPEHCLRLLHQRLARRDTPIVLIIDDAHHMSEPDRAVVQSLLDTKLSALHLVLLSRTALHFDRARALLQSGCLVLSTEAMQFDHDEFAACVRATGGDAHGDADELAQLERRADGWFAGLQFLMHAAPAETYGNGFDGYIETEVLSALSTETAAFLRTACEFPVLIAELCATLFDIPVDECQKRLTDAAASCGLIRSTKSATKYSAHPLLRETLRRRTTPDATRRRRAAAWLANHGEIDAALECAHPYDDHDLVVDIASAALRPAMLRYDLSTAHRLLDALPPALLSQRVSVAIDAAWLAHFNDDAPELRIAIERTRPLLADDAGLHEIRAELYVLDALCNWFESKLERARSLADEARRLPHAPNGLAAGFLAMADAYFPHDQENVSARIRTLQRASDIFEAIGHGHGAAEASATQGFIKWRHINGEGAVASLTHALSLMKMNGWEHSLAAAEADYACGEILYYMNRLDEARTHLQRAHEVSITHGVSPSVAHLATLMLEMCDLAEGRTHIDYEADARAWAEALTSLPPIGVGMVAILRVLRDFRAGQPTRCLQTIESLKITSEALQPTMHDVLWYAVLSGEIYGRRCGPSTEQKLREFRERKANEPNPWMMMRCDVLLAHYAQLSGNAALALECLTCVIPSIEESEMQRLILDHVSLMSLLPGCPLPYAQRITTASLKSRPFSLSSAELRVLQAMMAGLSPDEIAARLVLSRLTIYGHQRKIYQKLGVHDRAAAVCAARKAGIGEKE